MIIYYEATFYRITPPSSFSVSIHTRELGPLDNCGDGRTVGTVLNVDVGVNNGYLTRWKFNDDP